MRKTRGFFILLLVWVVFAFNSAKCEEKHNYVSGVFTNDDFSIIRTSDNSLIRYGMLREEVEKLFGKPEGKDFVGGDIYDGIIISYRNNKIVCFTAVYSSEKIVNYQTPRGIRYDSTMNDVELKYGKGIISDNTIIYLLDESDQGFVLINSYNEIRDPNKTYVLYFVFKNDHKSLSRIYIMDFNFSINMKQRAKQYNQKYYAILPEQTGWTGLACYYHLHEGWYEESPWQIPDVGIVYNQLKKDINVLDKDTQTVLNDIYEFLIWL